MDDSSLFPLIINGSNLVPSTYNNVYRYQPPVGAFTFPKGAKVTVSSISMYYSWYNFSDAYGNNSFSINFSGYGALAVNIGNQSLSITNLNSYVQQIMIQAGLYLVNSSGQNVYYFEIVENAATYQVQVNLFPVPSSLPSGWTNGGSLPLSGYAPQFVVPSTPFQQVVGFTAGTYGSATATATASYLSSFTPQVSPVQSVQVGCSLLRNYFNTNPTILYTFTSTGTTFGGLIQTSPNFWQYVDVGAGVYPYIDITFYDQSGTPLQIIDTNLTIMLLIKMPNK